MSKIDLKPFYEALQAWIDAGCPDENRHSFTDWCGICGNLEDWFRLHDIDTCAYEHMEAIFEREFGEDRKTYPFGTTTYDNYTLGAGRNDERLAYIKEQLK